MSKKKLLEAMAMATMMGALDKDDVFTFTLTNPRAGLNEILYDPTIKAQPPRGNKPVSIKQKKRAENKARAVQARINKKWKH